MIKTNADRIREMDDETLAEYLSMIEYDVMAEHDKPSSTAQWLEYLRDVADDEYEEEIDGSSNE